MEGGIAEYWIVDAEPRTITVVRPGEPDREIHNQLTWMPAGVDPPLVVELEEVFDG